MKTVIVKVSSGLQELINKYLHKYQFSRAEVMEIAKHRCVSPAVEAFKTQALLAYTFDLPFRLIPEINKENIQQNFLYPFNKKTEDIRTIFLHPLAQKIIESYDEMPIFHMGKALKYRQLFYQEMNAKKQVYHYEEDGTKALKELPFNLMWLNKGPFLHMMECGMTANDFLLLTGRIHIGCSELKKREEQMKKLFANPFFDHLKYLIP